MAYCMIASFVRLIFISNSVYKKTKVKKWISTISTPNLL